MSLDWVYIVIHVCFYGVLFSFSLLGLYNKLKFTGKTKIQLKDLTLIIPFRNEEATISSLLDELRRQDTLPHKIICVDDHSHDESAAIIRNRLNELNIEVIGLKEGIHGKKEAIKLAVRHVETKYALTVDADVKIHFEYFKNLELLDEADMWILPVVMHGNSWFEQFSSIDFTLSNILNRFFSLFGRPVLASGANLLFNVEAYKECLHEDHFEMLSGDDMFLLRDFRMKKKDIRATSDKRVKVKTDAPGTFSEWLDQRVRWISKSQKVGDPVPLIFVIMNVGIGLFFYFVLINELMTVPWNAFALLLFKLLYDGLLMAPHFILEKNFKSLLFLPLYDLLLPIYSVVMAVLGAYYKPEWKGRKVEV